MKKFQINKGVAIPPKQRGVVADLIRTMHVGDSFLVDRERSRMQAFEAARRIGVTITTRKIDGQGFRVWRTK
jgi:hypothetical protein